MIKSAYIHILKITKKRISQKDKNKTATVTPTTISQTTNNQVLNPIQMWKLSSLINTVRGWYNLSPIALIEEPKQQEPNQFSRPNHRPSKNTSRLNY